MRIVTITLKNGTKETLLTNLPQSIMTIDDLEYIYCKRWGIETNYNTLKNRFYIENYSSKKKNGHRARRIFKVLHIQHIPLPKINL